MQFTTLNYWQRKISEQNVSDRMKMFLKNLSFSFVGGLLAFAILFLINVLAARFLGPEEYGKYSFFASVATMIAAFLVMEIDSGISYFISKRKTEDQKKVISSFVLLFMGIIGFVALLLFYFQEGIIYFLNKFVDADLRSVVLILGLVAIFSFKRILDAVMRGKGLFFKQSLFKILEVTCIVVVFGSIYFLLDFAEYFDYFAAVFAGGLVVILVMMFYLRSDIKVANFSFKKIRVVYDYSKLGFISSISSVALKNADKFLVVAFFDVRTVGIYAAYYTAAILPAARINQLFINVYFPSITPEVNIHKLYKRLTKIFVLSAIPIFAGAAVSVYALVLVFGSEYPVEYGWILLLSFYVVVHFFASTVSWTVASCSAEGFNDYNIGIFWGLIAFVILIGGSIYWDKFSVSFLIVGFIINRLVAGLYNFIKLRRLAVAK